MEILLFLMAVVPSAVLLWLFLSNDRYPEPAGALISTFLLGVLIVLGIYLLYPFLSLIASALPSDNPYLMGAGQAFLMAALPEECFKLIALRRYCVNHPAFDEPMDGIVYGVTVSLGFATAENLLYVLDGGLNVAVGRAFLAVPCHALVGAVMGYHVGLAAFSRGERAGRYLKALGLAVLFHGLYDFVPLTFRAADSMNVAVPGTVTVGLNVFFGVVMFVLIRYVAVLTRSMRTMQREDAPPSFGFSRVLPNRQRTLDPALKRSRFRRWLKACRDETGPMDLLFAALCLVGVFCALAGAAHLGNPGDPMSSISLAVAVIFFVYGLGFAARGMGKLTAGLLRNRDGK
ncbi:PrsW family glutamic-type intramembrane protease [Pseudodesulfovibrio thermohalotolerans]|uniref:PrsW family glutamic-type intramembrane protease n=1 Tax=Pseudodesulfovibrio thermohalotolerans TaxID=2880651 RepID=UPI0024418FCC|nr:PrsW family glutamic-type intramembrane protease [Pseudodesulfovibrio thermohalotolerans]WFS62811.1 PrsW family glutamic-type intramembrane protease [Pseudodesulfovibrio thermohalotolerans]